MLDCTVRSPRGVVLPAGTVLRLAPEQLASRRHQVAPAADGLHVAAVPLSFKTGERLAIAELADKSLRLALDLESVPPRRAPKTRGTPPPDSL